MSTALRSGEAGGASTPRSLYRSEALLARSRPLNSPDSLDREMRGRRWPVFALFAFLAVDVVFAFAFRIPSFVNGPAIPGTDGQVLAVFPDAGGPLPRHGQEATVTGPQGITVELRVAGVHRVATESERDSLGLPSGVAVPFLLADLTGLPPGSDRIGGQVRVRVAERSLVETLLGGEGSGR